ncbi:MAG: alpha-galactosidase [Draconibacterium sp.]
MVHGCGWDKKNGEWHQNVGNWTVDNDRFPDGLRPVADAWFIKLVNSWFGLNRNVCDPETQIDKEHPEWLIKLPNNNNYLFNL